jgi:hypothetical protein
MSPEGDAIDNRPGSLMSEGRPMSRALVAVVALVVVVAAREAAAQDRGEAHGSLRLFAQPAPSDFLVVVTPSVSGRVQARSWLRFDVDWTADIVTGATPRTYGTPDIVTAATRFTEVRNVIGAGAAATAGPATISAGYAYGTENDYRSHLVRGGIALDLFHHDTTLALEYSHGFDRVCDLDQPGVPLTLRQPLDTSRGCFAGTPGLTEERLDIDALELTWTQTLGRALVGALAGSYQHLGGFQSNPYRRVRLDDGRLQAQESHPRQRDRGALTARLRYAVAKLQATVGGDLRLYRDTWGVQSITGELTWEQPFHVEAPAWRYVARARAYAQSGALFYRDVGWADSYERAGPVGRYFTADQELAPIADLLLGVTFVHVSSPGAEHRRWRLFTDVEWRMGLDYLKIFALTPEPPNAARTRGVVSALVSTFAATGRF